MMKHLLTTSAKHAIPLIALSRSQLKPWREKQSGHTRKWAETSVFRGDPATHLIVPDEKGRIGRVLVGVEEKPDIWSFAHLPNSLPSGTYYIDGNHTPAEMENFALGWLLGSYSFIRYKKSGRAQPLLSVPKKIKMERILILAESFSLARDMINTPTNDMGPDALAELCLEVAKDCKAECKIIAGDALLKANYPLIHAVGRASAVEPRLIDLRWGNKHAPKVTLVGKGVCFDCGGLNIKNAGNMKLMKKDMGGAAVVLSLARAIMLSKLGVRLRVLIPAVENSISGNAYRPMDVIRSRKGITVEIGNTDAEGRLILCDALSEADDEKPDLLIDCATLTGAARVALGTDVAAFFTPDDAIAADLYRHSREQSDPLWRLPLWGPYRDMLQSPSADLNSAPDSGYAGAITAALYLKEFVQKTSSWVHIDMMAWNLVSRPGRPMGGEAMALRALFAWLQERYKSLKKK